MYEKADKSKDEFEIT
ncbi:hypothetical protein D046_0396, partial [Vibrio parahaemolyticus V-223/04]